MRQVPPIETLTTRQREVLGFILRDILLLGAFPTIREIATEFDISSTNGVVCHLTALVSKGFLSKAEKDAGYYLAFPVLRLAAAAGLPLHEYGLPQSGEESNASVSARETGSRGQGELQAAGQDQHAEGPA